MKIAHKTFQRPLEINETNDVVSRRLDNISREGNMRKEWPMRIARANEIPIRATEIFIVKSSRLDNCGKSRV
jgi:hypothetical protein